MLMESLLMQNVDTGEVSWIDTGAPGSYTCDGKFIKRFVMLVHLWNVPEDACGVGLIPIDFILGLERR